MVLPFRSVPRIAAARLRALKALFWRHHQDLFLYTARPFLYVAGSLASYKLISEYLIALEGSSGPSMFPTLRVDGDFLLISRFQRYGRGVRIGDLVVYAQPQFSHFGAAKRIVGMPGDYVVVDPLVEPEQMQMTQVPEGHIWVAGDDLPYSRDSRHYGAVPLGLVKGKVTGKACLGSDQWPPFQWIRNPLAEPVQHCKEWKAHIDILGGYR